MIDAAPNPLHAKGEMLVSAAKERKWVTVGHLLKDPNIRDFINHPDADKRTALHWVAQHANTDLASLMKLAGADPALTDNAGQRPWDIAASNEDELMTHILDQPVPSSSRGSGRRFT